jgi:large subunit ribosomal protein L23
LILRPRLSEKTYALAQERDVYVFAVPSKANKHAVKRAVEAQFGVTVETVNVLNQTGKTKRTARRRTRPVSGRRADVKKVYVSLKKGDKIPIFATIEESEKKTKRAVPKTAPETSQQPKKVTPEKAADKPTGAVERGARRIFRRLTK